MTDDFATVYPQEYPINGKFLVLNIAKDKKTIRIWDYPIPYGYVRDMLKCYGISESSIRTSLLKGVLRNKIIAQEIRILESDVDLLAFNETQKLFLYSAGITEGIEIDFPPPGNLDYAWRQEIPLIGTKNGINRTFFTPEKFINGLYSGNSFHISIKHNGKDLYENIDYTIGESGIPGSGYDTINLISFTPVQSSILMANYVVKV